MSLHLCQDVCLLIFRCILQLAKMGHIMWKSHFDPVWTCPGQRQVHLRISVLSCYSNSFLYFGEIRIASWIRKHVPIIITFTWEVTASWTIFKNRKESKSHEGEYYRPGLKLSSVQDSFQVFNPKTHSFWVFQELSFHVFKWNKFSSLRNEWNESTVICLIWSVRSILLREGKVEESLFVLFVAFLLTFAQFSSICICDFLGFPLTSFKIMCTHGV